jgi:hypothetical protein
MIELADLSECFEGDGQYADKGSAEIVDLESKVIVIITKKKC